MTNSYFETTPRKSAHERRQAMVDHFKTRIGSDGKELSSEKALELMEIFEMGYDTGLRHGQADAQRAFRLALGVELPTSFERAYWNLPVPLAEKD